MEPPFNRTRQSAVQAERQVTRTLFSSFLFPWRGGKLISIYMYSSFGALYTKPHDVQQGEGERKGKRELPTLFSLAIYNWGWISQTIHLSFFPFIFFFFGFPPLFLAPLFFGVRDRPAGSPSCHLLERCLLFTFFSSSSFAGPAHTYI